VANRESVIQKTKVRHADRNYEAHPAHVELAKLFSSVKIMGPPMSEKLVELVTHLFSIEEAEICKALSFLNLKPVEKIARLCKRKSEEIYPVLKDISWRRVIHENKNMFMLYPMIPGIFEYVFMTGKNSEWHKKYAELINELFGTGYIKEYLTHDINAIRNIPVQQVIENKNFVVDADLMSNMIDAHDHFAVLHYCPCRHSKSLIGHTCRRAAPEDGCLVIGNFSKVTVANGNGRPVSKSEMSDIVADRWEKKLVFLTANVEPTEQNVICTCCDCCCHGLETANNYSSRFLAQSHFIAEVDESLCNNCGRCALVCNMHAHITENRKHCYIPARCIGCGHCISICKNNAIRIVENPSFKQPSKNYIGLLLKMLPSITSMGLKVKLKRYLENN